MNTMMINGEQFPYENAQYNDTSRMITGQHLFYCFTPDVPEHRVANMKAQGCINIEDLAEAKVIDQHPEYAELTYYGTRRKGYYALLKAQVEKTMYWALNKQPASFTMIVNKIDGITQKDDEPFNPNTIYGKIQLCLQLGVTVQIVIPDTGYSCVIPAFCNKKTMNLFTKDFLCERFIKQYKDGNLSPELWNSIAEIQKKVLRLQEYRNAVQTEIWAGVNHTLREYRDEWKCQNIYTLESRMNFAINAQAEELLAKYAIDFNIRAVNALTVEQLKQPKNYETMINIIHRYGPAFGISVKVQDTPLDCTTFMPAEWLRDDHKTLSESVMLKRYYRQIQSLKKAPLNELIQAYIQIDFYMNQPDLEMFLAEGYVACYDANDTTCKEILSKHEEFCPRCGTYNQAFEPDALSYDTVQDCVRGQWITEE